MPAKRTAKQIAASKRNLEKARRAKKSRRRTTAADMRELDTLSNLNAAVRNPKRIQLRLANGAKTGVMVPPQHARSGGKIYTATNSSGQAIRKRTRMDAQAIQQGYYQW